MIEYRYASGEGEVVSTDSATLDVSGTQTSECMSSEEFYSSIGNAYGGCFRAVQGVWRGDGDVLAKLAKLSDMDLAAFWWPSGQAFVF